MAEPVHILMLGGTGGLREAVERLAGREFSFEKIEPPVSPGAVAAALGQEDQVIVVDLVPDLAEGIDLITALRKAIPTSPIVAVAENPTVEQARSIRASGVFYLALHPVSVEEMRSVLLDALRSIDRHKPSASACITRKRILIVDDDADYCASMAALLEGEGYAVRCAPSAREGLERIEAERPDLIVLDIMMEDAFAGYGLNQAVKFGDKQAVAGEIPILMVSSIEQPPQQAFATALETPLITPDDYLSKPLDIPVFLEHVRRLLARPARAEQPR